IAPEATADQGYFPVSVTQATWNFPATNKFLIQGGFNYTRIYVRQGNPYASKSDVQITELSTGLLYGGTTSWWDPNGPNGGDSWNQGNGRISASYVTGSHAFKAGFAWMKGSN